MNWTSSANSSAFGGEARILSGLDTTPYAATYTLSDLAPGNYEVYATWPSDPSFTDSATYSIDSGPSVVDTNAEGISIFQPQTAAPTPSSDVAATVTINTSTGTITGDDSNPNTFFGTPFTESVVNGIATFYVKGDLVIGNNSTINIIGSLPMKLIVGDNLYVGTGVVFNASAINGVSARCSGRRKRRRSELHL